MPGITLSRPVTRTLGRNPLRPYKSVIAPSALAIDSVVSGTNNSAASSPMTTSSFTPTSADAVVLLGIRKSVTGTYSAFPVPSIGGVNCVKFDGAEQSGQAGNVAVYGYVIRGLTPGVSTALTWPGNGTNSPGKIVAFVFSLNNWQGNVGAHIAVTSHPASTTSGTVAAATPLVKKGSLMLGMAYGSDLSVQPFTASGFTGQGSARTSATGVAGAGTAFSKTGGAVGGTETLTPIAAAAFTDFGSVLVEIY